MSKVHDQLRQHLDGADGFMTGFQIGHARSYQRKPPAWTQNNLTLRRVLETAFPKHRTDPGQHRQAGRWAQVITLYFLLGYTAQQIAEEIDVKTSTVTGIIQRTRRVAAGHRANGTGPRGGKRGRPKKIVFSNPGTYREVCSKAA